MLSLLCVAALAQAQVYELDGLKVALPGSPGEPVESQSVRYWNGNVNEGTGANAIPRSLFMVAKADWKRKVDNKAAFSHFETYVRDYRNYRQPMLRRQVGSLGGRQLLVLNGSVLMPHKETVRPAHVNAACFVDGEKVFQVFLISFSEADAARDFAGLRQLAFTTEAGQELTASVLDGRGGLYSLRGVPFLVTFPGVPKPVSKKPGNYLSAYSATYSASPWNYSLETRTVKTSDKRTDGEIVSELASEMLNPDERLQLRPSPGSDAWEIDFLRNKASFRAVIHFARTGDAVAVAAVAWPEKSNAPDPTLLKIEKAPVP